MAKPTGFMEYPRELALERDPLERINEGFDLMAKGESIRSVVVY